MKDNELYLKIDQNIEVTNKKVFLSDVTKMYCTDKELVKNVGNEVLLVIKEDKEYKYMFSVMKVIDIIHKYNPSIHLTNLGEQDFIVDYKPPKPQKLWLEYLKTIFCCCIKIGRAHV